MILVVVAGWLDINFVQRTRLLTPLPTELMPMVWSIRVLGAVLGVAPVAIALLLGGGRLLPRNIMLALGALSITIFVMNHFAWRAADMSLFQGGNVKTLRVECPVLDFGGRRDHYAIVDCDKTSTVSVEIADSYYGALNAVRHRRVEGADLNVCLQLTVQTLGRNERLILPSIFDANPPPIGNCKREPGKSPP